jgi:hypothetical protein
MNCEHENTTAGKYKGRCNDCGAEGQLLRRVQLCDYADLPRCVYPVEGKPCGVYAPTGETYCREHKWQLAWEV